MYWVGRKEKDVQWERVRNMGPSWIKSEKETEKWRFRVLWNVDIYTNLFASTYSHKHAHVFYTNDWCLSSCVLVPFRLRTFCCRVINMILNNILQRWTYSSGTDDYSTRPKQQQKNGPRKRWIFDTWKCNKRPPYLCILRFHANKIISIWLWLIFHLAIWLV